MFYPRTALISTRLWLLLLAFAFFQISTAQTTGNKFEFQGRVTGFPDSTKLFLDTMNSVSGIVVWDSSYIINQRFHFAGTMKEPISQVVIHTKNFEDYKFVWLENTLINFTAVRGNLKKGKVTGSKTQTEQDLYDSIAGGDRDKSVLFIQKHLNSIVSAYILSVYASTWGKDTASMLLRKLSDKMKNSSYGQGVAEFVTLNRGLKVGDMSVDFMQKNTDGKDVSLSDFKGKVVLLDFWGSWCGPCRENNSELIKIYDEYKNKGFEILGVAADGDKAAWLAAIKKDGLTWTNVTDFNGPKNKAALMYGINKYPTNYLIDRKGILIGMDLYGDDLRTRLQQLLNGDRIN